MPAGRILLRAISESKKLATLKTDGARLLYTWLIPHVDVNGCFSGDPEVIKGQVFTRLRKTKKNIEEYLQNLHEVGLIVRYEAGGDQYIFLPTFEEKQPHLNKDREATPRIPLPTPDQLKTNSGANPDKIPLKLKFKVKFKEKVKENADLVSSIIEYLNQKTGKRFSAQSSATARHINARIAEGRTLDDFKRVIDVKAVSWKGDSRMDAYLRPETLFGTKMEGYLNEEIIPPKLSEVERSHMVGGRPAPTAEEKKHEKELDARVDEEIRKFKTSGAGAELQNRIEEARKSGQHKLALSLLYEQRREVEKVIANVRWGKSIGAEA